MHKLGKLNNEEIIRRENELRKTLQFFPWEKYLKPVKLNGYKYCVKSVILTFK
jgi:hypothetical protein